MSNDAVYAAGLLNRALDPTTQPAEIKEFLDAEDRLAVGFGLDYERSYIAEARRRAPAHVHFVTADATAIPAPAMFDAAVCLTNTWGTMSDKTGVVREMRRVAPRRATRLLSVYSAASIAPRREWYRRLGHTVVAETGEYLESDGGFRSEHFTDVRLRELVGECSIEPLTPIAFAVVF